VNAALEPFFVNEWTQTYLLGSDYKLSAMTTLITICLFSFASFIVLVYYYMCPVLYELISCMSFLILLYGLYIKAFSKTPIYVFLFTKYLDGSWNKQLTAHTR